MNGAIPPLPSTPSWRGAQLKHRDNFTFTFTLLAVFIIMILFCILLTRREHVVFSPFTSVPTFLLVSW
jgi:hypothetical protein